jgi:hypothetical protein
VLKQPDIAVAPCKGRAAVMVKVFGDYFELPADEAERFADGIRDAARQARNGAEEKND